MCGELQTPTHKQVNGRFMVVYLENELNFLSKRSSKFYN